MGSSGPTTVRSALMVWAKSASSTMLDASMGTQSARSSIPAFPGAQYTSVTRGLWRIFHTRACSRPPLPTTSIFTVQVLAWGRIESPKTVTATRELSTTEAIYGALLCFGGPWDHSPGTRASTSPRGREGCAFAAGCGTLTGTSSRSTSTPIFGSATPRPTSATGCSRCREGEAETTIGIDLTPHRPPLAVAGDAGGPRVRHRLLVQPRLRLRPRDRHPARAAARGPGAREPLRGRQGRRIPRCSAPTTTACTPSHGYTPAEPFLFELHAAMLRQARAALPARTSRRAGCVLDAGCGRSLFTEIRPDWPFRIVAADVDHDLLALAPGRVPARCAGSWATPTPCRSATASSTRSSRAS